VQAEQQAEQFIQALGDNGESAQFKSRFQHLLLSDFDYNAAPKAGTAFVYKKVRHVTFTCSTDDAVTRYRVGCDS